VGIGHRAHLLISAFIETIWVGFSEKDYESDKEKVLKDNNFERRLRILQEI
tara:strand:- start:518 stop:670 length:153 start_codon:yes stop_codon:yes gene_type:complete